MVENAAQRGQRHLRESGYTAHKGGDIHTDAKADAAMVAKGVHQHEAHMHRGEAKTKIKLKGGGKVPGHKGEARPDRRARGGSITADQPDDAQGNVGANSARARGGHVGKKGRTTVNINLGHGDQGNPAREQAAHQDGIKKGLMIGAAAHPPGPGALPTAPGGMPPHPPMGLPTGGPPGMGAPPMGGAPMMPPRPPMAGPPVGGAPGGMPPMMHKRGGAVRRADGGDVGGKKGFKPDVGYPGDNERNDARETMTMRREPMKDMPRNGPTDDQQDIKRGGTVRRDAEGRFTGGSI